MYWSDHICERPSWSEVLPFGLDKKISKVCSDALVWAIEFSIGPKGQNISTQDVLTGVTY